jgi:4-diphosphocytidyl-2-C-methyl-D-erythritol kinase
VDRAARTVSGVRLIAPAKLNWTLEALRLRPDGYHEIRSILQTLDLHDAVTLDDADDISLELTGDAGPLRGGEPERNLAFRAAVAFRARTGITRGVRITLDKHVPVAAGLGGGSSDGAAVLRGLNVLWNAGQSAMNLIEIAGEIGSDPPFFVVGGTAEVSGRGERVAALDDAIETPILLATPPPNERGEKTASMFAALSPDDYSEGHATHWLREAIDAGRAVTDGAMMNVFERVIAAQQPETANAMAALAAQGYVPHLCGAGPSFMLLAAPEHDIDGLAERIRQLGFEPRRARTLTRAAALAIERI